MNSERLRQILSHSSSLILLGIVVIFLAIYGVQGFVYFRQNAQLRDMEATRDQLQPIVRAASVGEEITRKEAELQAILKTIPPANLKEVDVFRTMLGLAAEVGLNPDEVDMELKSETARQKVGSQEYRVVSFRMTVSGREDAVWDLVQRMDRGATPYGTLILDKLSLTLGTTSQATMEFKIYVRPAS